MPFLQQVSRTRPRFATKGLLRISLALVGGLALMAFWSSISLPLGSLSLILGGLALTAFVIVERQAANPILPFVLFDNRSRVAALVAIFFASMIMMCMAVFISLYLQGILKYSPIQSGMAVVPFAFGLGIGLIVAGTLAVATVIVDDRGAAGGHEDGRA